MSMRDAIRAKKAENEEDDFLLLNAAVATVQAAAAAAAAAPAAAALAALESDGRSNKRPGGSNTHGRPVYADSTWGRMLREQAEVLKDPNSTQAKLFRRRFRVPYPLFLLYVEWATDELESMPPLAGWPPVPMTLKVLGVLRILGTGCSTDAVLELSGISESHMSKFFHQFCAWGHEKAFPVWVTWPKTTEDVAKAMGPYIALGLDGAIGSTDAVHIAWGGCPTGCSILHRGKEGYVISLPLLLPPKFISRKFS